jgi:hypothetical protein
VNKIGADESGPAGDKNFCGRINSFHL